MIELSWNVSLNAEDNESIDRSGTLPLFRYRIVSSNKEPLDEPGKKVNVQSASPVIKCPPTLDCFSSLVRRALEHSPSLQVLESFSTRKGPRGPSDRKGSTTRPSFEGDFNRSSIVLLRGDRRSIRNRSLGERKRARIFLRFFGQHAPIVFPDTTIKGVVRRGEKKGGSKGARRR